MKKFLIIPTALCALCAWAYADGGIVEIDGKKYVKDTDGKYVEVQIIAPARPIEELRRPARAGKFGAPHPSTWLPKDADAPAAQPTAARGFFVSIFDGEEEKTAQIAQPAQNAAGQAAQAAGQNAAAGVASVRCAKSLFEGLSIKEAKNAAYELIVKFENGVVVRKASLLIADSQKAEKPFDGVYEYCPEKPAYGADGAFIAEGAPVKKIPVGFYLSVDSFSIEEGADGLYAEVSFEVIFSFLKLAEYPSENGILEPVQEGARVKSALAFANGEEIVLRANPDNGRVLSVCLRRLNK